MTKRILFFLWVAGLFGCTAIAKTDSFQFGNSAHDGGLDAGHDAGVHDAGHDAASIDSDVVDAADTDAVVVDAAIDDAATDSATPVTAEVACGSYALAHCTERDRCSSNTNTALVYGDFSTCVVREKVLCEQKLIANGHTHTPENVNACAASLASQSCEDFWNVVETSACAFVAGTIANGGACAFSEQCASMWCAVARGVVCGTCQDAPTAGTSCALVPCGPGEVCTAAQTCAPVVTTAGASCDAANPCGAGLSCSGAAGSLTCQLAGNSSGVTCDAAARLAPSCDSHLGLYCNTSANQCAGVVSGTSSSSCSASDPSLVCGAASACTGAGTCSVVANDHHACNVTNGPTCVAPSVCAMSGDAGVCQFPSALSCH